MDIEDEDDFDWAVIAQTIANLEARRLSTSSASFASLTQTPVKGSNQEEDQEENNNNNNDANLLNLEDILSSDESDIEGIFLEDTVVKVLFGSSCSTS